LVRPIKLRHILAQRSKANPPRGPYAYPPTQRL
jgi:hypothetical protein